jgi:hypothetical protein
MGSRQIVLVSTAGISVLNAGIFWREAKTKRLFSQCSRLSHHFDISKGENEETLYPTTSLETNKRKIYEKNHRYKIEKILLIKPNTRLFVIFKVCIICTGGAAEREWQFWLSAQRRKP